MTIKLPLIQLMPVIGALVWGPILIAGVVAWDTFGMASLPVSILSLLLAIFAWQRLFDVLVFSYGKFCIERPKEKFDKTCCLPNGIELRLPYPVMTTIEHKKLYLVMLDVPKFEWFPQNVFGVDLDGAIQWQVDAVAWKTNDFHNRYLSITLEEHEVWCFNALGMMVRIDPSTGAILDTRRTAPYKKVLPLLVAGLVQKIRNGKSGTS